MYSKLKPFSFTGVSNSEMFLSEKDLSSMEISFLVRPPLEFQEADHPCCQIAPNFQDDESQQQKEERVQEDQQQQEKEEKLCKLQLTPLEINLPSSGEFNSHYYKKNNNEDGFKTPTSSDHKIPAMLKCPPAPRKPKSLPSPKRKDAFRRQKMLLDLTKEIESLFPPALLADLGNKIKTVRQFKEVTSVN